MPITKSAQKALKQSRKRALVNRRIKETAKRAIRLFKKNPTLKNLKRVYSALDKAAKKNVFHKNKTSRLKSRLSHFLRDNKKTSQKRGEKKAS